MDVSRAVALAALGPLCAVVAFFFLADLWFGGTVLREWWWAGLHLWPLPVAGRVALALVPLFVLALPNGAFDDLRRDAHARWQRRPPWLTHPAFLFPAGFLALWLFRSSHLIFGDGIFYTTDLIPSQAVSDRGLIINYDSIGATWLYSWGYRQASFFLGLDPLRWYNLAGLVTLLAFLGWLWISRERGRTLAAPACLLLLFAGNWSQATMGPPEHYAQLLLASLAFAILAVGALEGREPLWKPLLAYALGAFFHLGMGWIFPAVVYLAIRRWRQETTEGRWLAMYAVAIPAFLTLGLAYYHRFDLTFFLQGNAARGKLIPFLDPQDPFSGEFYQYSTLAPRHLAHIAQEVLLMGWPGVIALAGGAAAIDWRRVVLEPAGQFLLVLLASTLAFNLLWNPDLGFWRDQDLFSIIGLAMCLLGAWAVLGPPGEGMDPALRTRLVAAAIAGGLAWRLPVIVYHSLLSPNYWSPVIVEAAWPFPPG